MLKGRSKSFAPKKGPVRRPGGGPSAPSSTRPSVERQSQTPAPSLPAEDESIPNNEQNKVTQEDATEQNRAPAPDQVTEEHVPEQSRAIQQNRVTEERVPQKNLSVPQIQATVQTQQTNHLKRKSQEVPVTEPSAKRVSLEPERQAAEEQVSKHNRVAQQNRIPVQDQVTAEDFPEQNQVVQQNQGTAQAQRTSPLQRKPQVPAAEPPAKRVSLEPERTRASVSEAQNTGVADITQDGRPEEDIARQNVPPREPSPSASAAPESQHTVLPADTNSTKTQATEAPSQSQAAEAPILPSIETNERDRSPSPARNASLDPPRYRYPSPENIVRIVDDSPEGTPANMGPPGGPLGAAGDVNAIVTTGEIVQMAILNPDGTSGRIIEEPASGTERGKKKKKVVRRRKVQTAEDDDDDTRATIDMGLTKAKRAAARRLKKKKEAEKKRKEREQTPSDAEDEVIDPAALTMTDLCKDLRIGKKFSMHDVIKQRVMKKKQEAQRDRLREKHPELISLLDAEDQDDAARVGEAGPSGTNSAPATAPASQPPAEKEAPSRSDVLGAKGVQFRIVNGEIVIDDDSTMINRQAEAEAARAGLEEVEENEFTKVITAGTFMKREPSKSWDAAATDLFYKALNQYGTDFGTIAKLFPHRSRRQIKLKFNNEERKNPAKVTRYLTQPKKPIDLDHFENISGLKLEDVAVIKAEQERLAKEQEADLAKHVEAAAQADRQKKAEIAQTSEKREAARRMLASVGDESDDETPNRTAGERTAGERSAGESAKENAAPAQTTGKGKKKSAPKMPRKNKHSHYAGGDEVVVLGTID